MFANKVIFCFLVFLSSIGLGRSTQRQDNDVFQTSEGVTEWRLPGGLASIQWKRIFVEDQAMLQFTITGRAQGYIAMAISADRTMGPADDAYVCMRSRSLPRPSSNPVQIFSAHLVARQIPLIDGLVEEENVVEVSLENNTITCTFRRPRKVTKLVSGESVTWDLASEKYHILYAHGDVSDGMEMLPHSYRASTAKANLFLSESSDKPEQDRLSLPPFLFNNNITTLSHGGGRWKLGCGSSGDCRSVVWEPKIENKKRRIKISLTGNGYGWIGLLVNRIPTLHVGGNCYVCFTSANDRTRVIVAAATCRLDGPPMFNIILTDDVLEARIVNGSMTCTFMRPAVETKLVNGQTAAYDMSNGSFIFVYSEGNMTPEGDIGIPVFLASTSKLKPFVNFDEVQTEKELVGKYPLPQISSSDGIIRRRDGSGGWNFPLGCTDDCRSVGWSSVFVDQNGDSMIQFNVQGLTTGYIALSILSNLRKAYADIYICIPNRAEPKRSIVKSGYRTPDGQIIADRTIATGRVLLADSAMTCTFSRPIRVSRRVSADQQITWDLSAGEFFLSYAEGAIGEMTEITLHTYSIATYSPLNLIHRDMP